MYIYIYIGYQCILLSHLSVSTVINTNSDCY